MKVSPVWAWDHAGQLAEALGVDQSRIRVSLESGDVVVLDAAGRRERTVDGAEVERLLRAAGVEL